MHLSNAALSLWVLPTVFPNEYALAGRSFYYSQFHSEK
jgi:hypothetical protein